MSSNSALLLINLNIANLAEIKHLFIQILLLEQKISLAAVTFKQTEGALALR